MTKVRLVKRNVKEYGVGFKNGMSSKFIKERGHERERLLAGGIGLGKGGEVRDIYFREVVKGGKNKTFLDVFLRHFECLVRDEEDGQENVNFFLDASKDWAKRMKNRKCGFYGISYQLIKGVNAYWNQFRL
jgi:hypothetical protein